MSEAGVVAAAREIVEIAEVAPLLAATSGVSPFGPDELAYARGKSDPERRLAARLAAKRAAARALGGGVQPQEVEVGRGPEGPPRAILSPRARRRLKALGARRVLLSLTHGRSHAAAAVLLVGE